MLSPLSCAVGYVKKKKKDAFVVMVELFRKMNPG